VAFEAEASVFETFEALATYPDGEADVNELIGKQVGSAMAAIAMHGDAARGEAKKALIAIDDAITEYIATSVGGADVIAVLKSIPDEVVDAADGWLIIHVPGEFPGSVKRFAAVGFLGHMVSVYDDQGQHVSD
jgi:hypothetical protein